MIGDPQKHRGGAQRVQIMPANRVPVRVFRVGDSLETRAVFHSLNTQTSVASLFIRTGRFFLSIQMGETPRARGLCMAVF